MANMINHANRISPFKDMGGIGKSKAKGKGNEFQNKVGKDFDVSLTNHGKFFAAREANQKKDASIQDVTEKKWNITPEEEKLSPKAQEFLAKLREQYGDYEFLIADGVENPLDIAGPSDKSYFVMFTTEEIERMAEDEEYANQMMGKVDSGVNTLNELQENGELGEGVRFSRLGISFDEEGNIKLFAELEKFTEKQEEIRQAAMEKRAEDKKLNRDHSKAPPQRPTVPSQQELTIAIKAYGEKNFYSTENVWNLLQNGTGINDGNGNGVYNNYTGITTQYSAYYNFEIEATFTTTVQDGLYKAHHGPHGHHGHHHHGAPRPAEAENMEAAPAQHQRPEEAAPAKTVRIEAGSVEELIEKAKGINWDE
ncbi:hypothetical protein D081_0654 [Anaerovibrio sp. JC8]|uniref:DUF6033 family protein n=1 Tax=Anaerovibrio sp. JC8 TaxID=1240085 RepID=UPI000A0A59F4|nr:DUF6033 family protein [Anaerovibrio sp. JC8]ORU00672.1 hypothetical protein D081_0654 [Anaerovibrio sp. JC8]